MRTNATLRNLVILGFTSLIIYAVIDGVRTESPWGFMMAIGSLFAFFYSIHLSKKLARLQEEEEQQY